MRKLKINWNDYTDRSEIANRLHNRKITVVRRDHKEEISISKVLSFSNSTETGNPDSLCVTVREKLTGGLRSFYVDEIKRA